MPHSSCLNDAECYTRRRSKCNLLHHVPTDNHQIAQKIMWRPPSGERVLESARPA